MPIRALASAYVPASGSRVYTKPFSALLYPFLCTALWFMASFLSVLLLLVPLLLAVALFTLLERKLMASVQLRAGPSILGLYGLLQPIADALKLLSSELLLPRSALSVAYVLTPALLFILSFLPWGGLPLKASSSYYSAHTSMLLYFALSSISVLMLVLAGWSSQSSYALYGTLRLTSQLLSYELLLATIFLLVYTTTSSLSFLGLLVYAQPYCSSTRSFLLLLPWLFPLYIIMLLAETNRAPFDLPEAEAELVAGYNVEYGSSLFTLFFLAEYNAILLLGCIGALLLTAYSASVLMAFLVTLLSSLTILIRAAYPRYRYDQLMSLC